MHRWPMHLASSAPGSHCGKPRGKISCWKFFESALAFSDSLDHVGFPLIRPTFAFNSGEGDVTIEEVISLPGDKHKEYVSSLRKNIFPVFF